MLEQILNIFPIIMAELIVEVIDVLQNGEEKKQIRPN